MFYMLGTNDEPSTDDTSGRLFVNAARTMGGPRLSPCDDARALTRRIDGGTRHAIQNRSGVGAPSEWKNESTPRANFNLLGTMTDSQGKHD